MMAEGLAREVRSSISKESEVGVQGAHAGGGRGGQIEE